MLGLHYEEFGDKEAPLIVFLHGGGVSSWMWDQQMDDLRHYHGMTVDLPEHGASAGTGPFSIVSSARQINELIDKKAQGKSVTLVGFSLGAQVVIQMLSLQPRLADYAIINSALTRPNPRLGKMMGPALRWFFPLVKNKSFAKLQAKTLYIGEDQFDTYYKETSQMKADTLVRVMEENMSFQIPDSFRQAEARILVTVGEKEKTIMKRSAMDLVASHPDCTGILIPNVGHGISLANPAFFNQMVEGWIKDRALPEGVKTIDT